MIGTRNNLTLLLTAVLFFIAGAVFRIKIEYVRETVTESAAPVAGQQSHAGDHIGQSTRDCRDWSPIKYSTVKSGDGEIMEIENDAEDHEHRLKSWNKKWKSYESKVPRSGIGSTLQSSKNFREGLENVVEYLKAELKKDKISILDSSCGDMNWMPSFLQGRDDVEYTGYDLLPVNIDTAKDRFANETWKFQVFDLVKDRISTKFDLLVNRHTAIHLGLQDNIQMFHNFYQSGSAYLLTTTYPLQTRNTQLFLPGDRKFHEINLSLLPFQFPAPICQAPDATHLESSKHQFYGLWDFKHLGTFDDRNEEYVKPLEG